MMLAPASLSAVASDATIPSLSGQETNNLATFD
jgi:hypothetical protein